MKKKTFNVKFNGIDCGNDAIKSKEHTLSVKVNSEEDILQELEFMGFINIQILSTTEIQLATLSY